MAESGCLRQVSLYICSTIIMGGHAICVHAVNSYFVAVLYMYVRMLFCGPFCWIEYSNINCYAILFMNSTQFGRSALSHAAELGHLSIVRLMICQFGCSVEESTNVSISSTSVAILAALMYLQI